MVTRRNHRMTDPFGRLKDGVFSGFAGVALLIAVVGVAGVEALRSE